MDGMAAKSQDLIQMKGDSKRKKDNNGPTLHSAQISLYAQPMKMSLSMSWDILGDQLLQIHLNWSLTMIMAMTQDT